MILKDANHRDVLLKYSPYFTILSLEFQRTKRSYKIISVPNSQLYFLDQQLCDKNLESKTTLDEQQGIVNDLVCPMRFGNPW